MNPPALLLLLAAQIALGVAATSVAITQGPRTPAPSAPVTRASTSCGGTPLLSLPGACTHGADAAAPAMLTRRSAPSYAVGIPVPLRCSDGTSSGNRVQVVYAHFGSAPDRLGALRSRIATAVLETNGVFALTARRQGGYRALRVVQTSCGRPSIADVQLSSAARTSFDRTIFELSRAGFRRVDRKYLVFADTAAMCGIASVYSDDRATPGNVNNAGPSYARVDNSPGCWNGVVAAHEVTHMLGGVQRSAPHATALNHCTDGHDVMCYDDGSPQSRSLTEQRCGLWHSDLLDCGSDDYFNVHPRGGSYLATHWDIASSSFLYGVPRQPGVRLPGAPTVVRVLTASLRVDVTWHAASGTVSQYVIRRNGAIAGTVDGATRTWRDLQPVPGRTNVYTVAAQNSTGVGRAAGAAIFVPAIPQPPSTVTAQTDWSQVTVSWSSEAHVDRWSVLRDGSVIASLPASTTQYVDKSPVTYGHTYQIVASNVSGSSSPSSPVDSGAAEWLFTF